MDLLSFFISVFLFPVLFTNVFGFRVIGLTGSISTGKSTVTRTLKNLGIPVIDFDYIAREVVSPNSACVKEIAKAFGKEVLQPDGSLDRAKLGDIIFKDVQKRKQLDAIMKRPIILRFLWLLLQFFFLGQIPNKSKSALTQTAQDEGPLSPSHGILSQNIYPGLEQAFNGTKILVLDCPLLFESGISYLCTSTVFINCSDEVQLERLMKRDSIGKEQAEAKINAQWKKDSKSKLASYIIDNSGTTDELYTNICSWWKNVTENDFGVFLQQPKADYNQFMAGLNEKQRDVQDQFDIYNQQVIQYKKQQWEIKKQQEATKTNSTVNNNNDQSLPQPIQSQDILPKPIPPKYRNNDVFPDVKKLMDSTTIPSFWQSYQLASYCFKPTLVSALFTGALAVPSYFIIQWLENSWFTPTKK